MLGCQDSPLKADEPMAQNLGVTRKAGCFTPTQSGLHSNNFFKDFIIV
jgi:hypothetical protein